MDIGLTTLFWTEEINNNGCEGLPESTQDNRLNDSSESLKKNTNRKMNVLSAKTKTRTGFWNVGMAYETGKLAQVTAEMRRYHLHILGVSKSRWTGSVRCRTNTGDTVIQLAGGRPVGYFSINMTEELTRVYQETTPA